MYGFGKTLVPLLGPRCRQVRALFHIWARVAASGDGAAFLQTCHCEDAGKSQGCLACCSWTGCFCGFSSHNVVPKVGYEGDRSSNVDVRMGLRS